jgi:serine/threonine protein kinase
MHAHTQSVEESSLDQYFVHKAKGEIIASGVSGIIELISPDRVAKSPWPGNDAELCRRDIRLEAEVYRTLGDSPCYVKFFGYDTQDGSITLEYMKHGTLREYLAKHNDVVSVAQRFNWALRAAEGLHILHSVGFIHCDFSPRNLLLDDDLQVKVADFGGCSMNGSWSSAMGSVRFLRPRCSSKPPNVQTDVFALGSTLYEIMTGVIPYEDISSAQVRQLYALSQFPTLNGVQGEEVIRACWLLETKSADEVYEMLQAAYAKSQE